MFKEILLAIVLGALLGFGLMGGYLAINKKNSPKETQTITPAAVEETDISQKETTPLNEDITISSPEDYDIVSKDQIEISGKTKKTNSTIIVISGNQVVDTKSDSEGNFKINISLESGLNIIKITSIDNDNNQSEKTINITYSTAKI